MNHTHNFVDPELSTHTNKIESLWCVGKGKFKDMRGCNRMYIQSYLDELVWRHNNKLSRHEAYNKILAEIVVFNDKFSVKEIESNVVTINGPDAEIGDSYENDENDDISSVSSDFEHELSLDFF